MEFPLFSQIPRVVLEKLDSKKKVKFTRHESDSENNEDEDVCQVKPFTINPDLVHSSKLCFNDIVSEQPKQKSALKTALKINNCVSKVDPHVNHQQKSEDGLVRNRVEVLDAIVQTNPKLPTRDISTQTHDTYPPMLNNYNLFKTQLEANALSKFNPMYSFPKCNGEQPPLKIGLTLRGKKRKVYYPDDYEEEQKIAPAS